MQTLLNKIKSFRYSEVLLGVCIAIIGLITIIFPGIAIQIISFGLGILLLYLGIVRMFSLFSTPGADVFFFIRFLGNLFFIFCAIGLLFFHTYLSSLVCSLCGIYLLIDSAIKLFELLARPHARTPSFWLRLVLTSLSLILGLALLITPGSILSTLFRLVGVALLIEGISSIFYAILRLKENKKKSEPKHPPIEGSFTDRTK